MASIELTQELTMSDELSQDLENSLASIMDKLDENEKDEETLLTPLYPIPVQNGIETDENETLVISLSPIKNGDGSNSVEDMETLTISVNESIDANGKDSDSDSDQDEIVFLGETQRINKGVPRKKSTQRLLTVDGNNIVKTGGNSRYMIVQTPNLGLDGKPIFEFYKLDDGIMYVPPAKTGDTDGTENMNEFTAESIPDSDEDEERQRVDQSCPVNDRKRDDESSASDNDLVIDETSTQVEPKENDKCLPPGSIENKTSCDVEAESNETGTGEPERESNEADTVKLQPESSENETDTAEPELEFKKVGPVNNNEEKADELMDRDSQDEQDEGEPENSQQDKIDTELPCPNPVLTDEYEEISWMETDDGPEEEDFPDQENTVLISEIEIEDPLPPSTEYTKEGKIDFFWKGLDENDKLVKESKKRPVGSKKPDYIIYL